MGVGVCFSVFMLYLNIIVSSENLRYSLGRNEAEKRDREGRPSRLVTFMILLAKNNPLVRSLCVIVRSAHVRHAVLTLTLTRCLGFRTLVRIRWHSLLGSRVQHYKFFPTPVSLPFFNPPERKLVYDPD